MNLSGAIKDSLNLLRFYKNTSLERYAIDAISKNTKEDYHQLEILNLQVPDWEAEITDDLGRTKVIPIRKEKLFVYGVKEI